MVAASRPGRISNFAASGRAHAFKFRGIHEKFELISQGTSGEAMTKMKPRIFLIDTLSKEHKKTFAQFARIQIGQMRF
jgi:hypothetical protein